MKYQWIRLGFSFSDTSFALNHRPSLSLANYRDNNIAEWVNSKQNPPKQ
jgi:hypothetical protein